MSALHTLLIDASETFRQQFRWKLEADSPIDLAGATMQLIVRRRNNQDTPIYTQSLGNIDTSIDKQIAGTVHIALDDIPDLGFKNGYYWITVLLANGDTVAILEGLIQIS